MPGVHDRVVGKRKQYLANRSKQHGEIAARQIGAADRAGKERVADEERCRLVAGLAYGEADAAGAMTRRVMDVRFIPAESPRTLAVVEKVDGRLWFDAQAEH